ncbi:MAG: Hpt domain-containing protein [Clostridia bacterium]|nr:Hpt domain-containing protein [Clostridia bacterium]
MQVINDEVSMMYCGNDKDIQQEVIESFCNDGSKRTCIMKQSMEQKDYTTYELETHTLKSVAMAVGAVDLAELAKLHNNACKKKEYQFVAIHWKELYEKYVDTIKTLRHLTK